MKRVIVILAVLCWWAVLSHSLLWAQTAEEWCAKGDEAYKAQNYATAVEHYSKALSMKPDYPAALLNRGKSYYHLKKPDHAFLDLNKVKDTKGTQPEALSYMGLIVMAGGRHELAESYFAKAYEISKKPADCLNAATAALKAGHAAKAIKYCQEVLRQDPENLQAQQILAQAQRGAATDQSTLDRKMFRSVDIQQRVEKLRDKVSASAPATLRKHFFDVPGNFRKDDYIWEFGKLNLNVDCVDCIRMTYLVTDKMLDRFYKSDPDSIRFVGNNLLVMMLALGGTFKQCNFPAESLGERLYDEFGSLIECWKHRHNMENCTRYKKLEKFKETVRAVYDQVEPLK